MPRSADVCLYYRYLQTLNNTLWHSIPLAQKGLIPNHGRAEKKTNIIRTKRLKEDEASREGQCSSGNILRLTGFKNWAPFGIKKQDWKWLWQRWHDLRIKVFLLLWWDPFESKSVFLVRISNKPGCPYSKRFDWNKAPHYVGFTSLDKSNSLRK